MCTARNCVILESENEWDLSQHDLDDLADDLREQLRVAGRDDIVVAAVAHSPTGVGNHWADYINVFLPSADVFRDAVWTIILEKIASVMLRRFSRPHEGERPRIVIVRDGMTGELVRVLEAKNHHDGFVEIDAEVVERRPPPPLPLEPLG